MKKIIALILILAATSAGACPQEGNNLPCAGQPSGPGMSAGQIAAVSTVSAALISLIIYRIVDSKHAKTAKNQKKGSIHYAQMVKVEPTETSH